MDGWVSTTSASSGERLRRSRRAVHHDHARYGGCNEGAGIRRWGLAIPYTVALAEQVARNYGAEGLECVRHTTRDWQTDGEVAATPADLRLMMEEAYEPGIDAVAVVCTNLAAAPLVVEFENEFDTTVFDSVAVTFHHCLGVSGLPDPVIRGWGRAVGSR